MKVKLIGPDPGHETTHTVDAATAMFLAVQLTTGRDEQIVPVIGGYVTKYAPGKLTIDDEPLRVKHASIAFFTEGDRFDSELTLTLEKA